MVAGRAPVALHRATSRKKEEKEVWSRSAGEHKAERLQRGLQSETEIPVAAELHCLIRKLSCRPYPPSGRRACFPKQEVQRAGGTEMPSMRLPPNSPPSRRECIPRRSRLPQSRLKRGRAPVALQRATRENETKKKLKRRRPPRRQEGLQAAAEGQSRERNVLLLPQASPVFGRRAYLEGSGGAEKPLSPPGAEETRFQLQNPGKSIGEGMQTVRSGQRLAEAHR
ncbi:UNVERIFIED_CONTAM: hypothetical protein K2H54_071485 [Gekko kuhli]